MSMSIERFISRRLPFLTQNGLYVRENKVMAQLKGSSRILGFEEPVYFPKDYQILLKQNGNGDGQFASNTIITLLLHCTATVQKLLSIHEGHKAQWSDTYYTWTRVCNGIIQRMFAMHYNSVDGAAS